MSHPNPLQPAALEGHSRSGLWLAVALLAVGFGTQAAPVAAESNALANGSFHTTSLNPWVDSSGAQTRIHWSSVNFSAQAGSGSMVVADREGSFFAVTAKSECIAISGGSQNEVGGVFRASSETPSCVVPAGCAVVGRYYYAGNNCTDSISASGNAVQFSVQSSGWTYMPHSHVAPAAARSMRMFVTSGGGSLNGVAMDYDLHADDLFLHLAGQVSPTLLADGFESGDTSAWSASELGRP